MCSTPHRHDGHLYYQPCFVRSCPGFCALRRLEPELQRPAYTHYSPTGSTRIDRFYMTQDLLLRKTGIEILLVAFTDHNAVVLRLSIPTMGTGWRRGRCKIERVMLTEAAVKDEIRCEWARWRRSRHY
jgi:hypothetical protein